MVVNRVGDTFLSVAFFGVFWAFGNLDYATVYSLSPYMNETVLTVIGLLFLFAAMGKSAQLGLHTWLPDAMEGPTPVSALIHAANSLMFYNYSVTALIGNNLDKFYYMLGQFNMKLTIISSQCLYITN
jgi:formate hydrogenlyase subunit 3/multisubunit Na+/H+ antiporter MnhD subunit